MAGRGSLVLAGIVLLSVWAPASAATPRLELDFPRTAGTVGDRLPVVLRAEGDGAEGWEPLPLPEKIGVFSVLDGAWSQGEPGDGDRAWVWFGGVAAYETGELEFPALTVRFQHGEELLESTTAAIPVTIESVLGSGDEGGEISDLKGPAAVDPDYSALILALSILAIVLAVAFAVWQIQRRYAGRLAAVPQPADPFKRMAPHEWAYQALQELLRTGNADPDHAGPFFDEIARILKLYLGGRFRVDLMECTTAEIVPVLRQAGGDPDPIDKTENILISCDQVKFADHRPRPSDFRSTVEEAYALVDATRPVEAVGRGEA